MHLINRELSSSDSGVVRDASAPRAAGAPEALGTSPSQLDGSSNFSGDVVSVSVCHRVGGPNNELLARRPYLGDLFDAIVADASFRHDRFENRTKGVYIEFTEDDRRRLRVWPRSP